METVEKHKTMFCADFVDFKHFLAKTMTTAEEQKLLHKTVTFLK
jgi:hypothetical protein